MQAASANPELLAGEEQQVSHDGDIQKQKENT